MLPWELHLVVCCKITPLTSVLKGTKFLCLDSKNLAGRPMCHMGGSLSLEVPSFVNDKAAMQ